MLSERSGSQSGGLFVRLVTLLKGAWRLESGFSVGSEKMSRKTRATWEIVGLVCVLSTH